MGLAAGLAAGSVALIGFALDSVVESSSAAALIWRLRREQSGGATTEDIERRAVRIVGAAFFTLAAYVGGQALYDLVIRSEPEPSTPGIILAAVSLVVMPLLAYASAGCRGPSTAGLWKRIPRRHGCAPTSPRFF